VKGILTQTSFYSLLKSRDLLIASIAIDRIAACFARDRVGSFPASSACYRKDCPFIEPIWIAIPDLTLLGSLEGTEGG
jgi:hypothetical protein